MQSLNVSAKDTAALAHVLAHDHHDLRRQMQDFAAKDPIYIPRYDISLVATRELAFQRLNRLAQQGFISVFDFEKDPLRIFAAHEMAGIIDQSMATKMTVQWNLFGGTVIKLGTKRHRALLKEVDDLSSVGCFALTELGFGNNAIKMETTAHYVCSKQESFHKQLPSKNKGGTDSFLRLLGCSPCPLDSRDSRVGNPYTDDQWAKVLDQQCKILFSFLE